MTRDREVCCRTCTFWPDEEDAEDGFGTCQRYPPQFQISGERVGQCEIWKSTTAFPRTRHDEVCGEYDSAEVHE